MIYIDVDTAVTVPVNIMPLTDDTDFKSREVSIAYNATGMDLVWNFVTPNGTITQTAVTPTTAGDYDWSHVGDGMYKIEIPASGGVSINNDTEGVGYFSGVCDGVLPWRGPDIVFRAAGLNDALIESAYSTTRGLAGTALPAAAADAAGGLPISDAGGLDLDTLNTNVTTVLTGQPSQKYNGPRGPGVYLDTVSGTSGSTLGTHGTVDTPTDTLANAITLVGSLGAKRIYLKGASTVALTGQTLTGYEFIGLNGPDENTVNLGTIASPSVLTNCYIEGCTVYGTHDESDRLDICKCEIDDAPAAETTTLRCLADFSHIKGDIIISGNADVVFTRCGAGTPNSSPTLTADGVSGSLLLEDWNGPVTFAGLSASHDVTITGRGHATFDAGNNVNASVSMYGWFTYTDNTAGMNNLTIVSTAQNLNDKIDTVDTVVDAVLVDTAEIGVAGAGLTEAGGTGDQFTAIPWNASWDTEVQSEVNDGLVALGLDHLVAASVTGTDVTDDSIFAKLVSKNEIAADWDDFDNTTDSLQGQIDKILTYVQLIVRKDAAIAIEYATDLNAINNDYGGGAGAYSNQTDSQEALRDWIGNGSNLTEAGGTGDHLTAINLPDQTMNINGNITGNLSGSVGSVTNNVGGNVTGSVGSLATQAKADVNAEVVDALQTDTPVAGVTIVEALRRIGTITSGKVINAGSGTETFYDFAESASTIVIVVDSSGNRSSITYN